LKRNLPPSAAGWMKPPFWRNVPTNGIQPMSGWMVRFGPMRPWIQAEALRSSSTLYPAIVITIRISVTPRAAVKYQAGERRRSWRSFSMVVGA
jgi:hypothetical protein